MTRDNKNTPVISIVLPTYNRAYILPEAIQSVLRQTYTDWELIVVDDGSTDNTREVVMSFTDSRIRYVQHEHNKGLAAGRNTGIREAHGEFIANLDSDDVWLPHKLEKELSKFTPGVDVVYSRYERTLADGRVSSLPPDIVEPKEGNLQKVFLADNIISMQMAIIRREVFEKYGMFDESIQAMQDWELWLRLAPHCRFAYVPEVLTTGSVLPDSIARNREKRLLARAMIFQKHEQMFRTDPSIYAYHAFRIGHAYALRGEISTARTYLYKALRTKPYKILYIAGYALALVSDLLHSPALYKKLASR